MNRFSKQIGVLKKETIYLITDFFIEYIYRRFNMIHYCLTSKENIVLETRESIDYNLPKVDDTGNPWWLALVITAIGIIITFKAFTRINKIIILYTKIYTKL